MEQYLGQLSISVLGTLIGAFLLWVLSKSRRGTVLLGKMTHRWFKETEMGQTADEVKAEYGNIAKTGFLLMIFAGFVGPTIVGVTYMMYQVLQGTTNPVPPVWAIRLAPPGLLLGFAVYIAGAFGHLWKHR